MYILKCSFGCYFFLATESSETKKADDKPTVQMTSETNPQSVGSRLQRHSLIGLFTGGETQHHNAPTKTSLLNETLLQQQIKESSSSTSHVSTPNQGINDGQDGNITGPGKK